MREEEAGIRYLSPLVKQDLAKLDSSDGESRRIALKSLKQFVEQLDASSMPRFLAQIGESREPSGSQSYAISLYEEVARVHRKLIVPHLPRVMTSLIRSLAASGSSPQLKQACAKVTAALARYTIDPTMSMEDAEEIIREICDPLAQALAGKLEPVAAGSAACIQALLETENWKYACNETVHEVCQRTAVALSERSTRTVCHMQLACTLASMNPDTLGVYCACLLRAAEEILKISNDSWQHRKAAARLLQALLKILDKETLETEVNLAIYALESCRHDRMPHVRAAVSEALYTAKLLASGDSSQSCGMAKNLICKSMGHSSSVWSKSEGPISPVPKRTVSPNSQESNHLSFSPASTSTVESMHIRQTSSPARSSRRRSKRTPLYPARGRDLTRSLRFGSPGKIAPSSSSTDERETPSQKLDAKENMPARIVNVNGALTTDGHVQGQPKPTRSRVPNDAYSSLTPTYLNKFGVDSHSAEEKSHENSPDSGDRSPIVATQSYTLSNGLASRHMTPLVSAILEELTETATSILAEDDAGLAQIDSKIEEACILRPKFRSIVLPRLRLRSFDSPDLMSQCDYAAGDDKSNQSSSSTILQTNVIDPDGDVRSANGCVERFVEVEMRELASGTATDTVGVIAPGYEGSDEQLLLGSNLIGQANTLKHHYNVLAQLDVSPQENSKAVVTTKDFLPYTTPKRLMRALQSLNPTAADSRRVKLDQDTKFLKDDAVRDVVDMDVETSSEAGWSVRDNPIASDESFQADSSDEEDLHERQRGLHEAIAYPLKVASADGISPRDIHMLSPVCHNTRSADVREAGLDQVETPDSTLNSENHTSTPSSSEGHHSRRGDQSCSTCKLAIQKPMSCELRPACPAAKNLELDSEYVSSKLRHLLNENEVEKNVLRCSCPPATEGSIIVESFDDEDIDGLPEEKSLQEEPQSWWNSRALGQCMLVRWMSRNWKRAWWYAEIVLGSTLCVVLTLPFAMALVKALTAHPNHLVPT